VTEFDANPRATPRPGVRLAVTRHAVRDRRQLLSRGCADLDFGYTCDHDFAVKKLSRKVDKSLTTTSDMAEAN